MQVIPTLGSYICYLVVREVSYHMYLINQGLKMPSHHKFKIYSYFSILPLHSLSSITPGPKMYLSELYSSSFYKADNCLSGLQACRMLSSMTFNKSVQVVFSLCMEFLPASTRGFWLVFMEVFWTVSSFTTHELSFRFLFASLIHDE